MKKTSYLLFAAFAILLALAGCKKDRPYSDPPNPPNPPNPPDFVDYEGTTLELSEFTFSYNGGPGFPFYVCSLLSEDEKSGIDFRVYSDGPNIPGTYDVFARTTPVANGFRINALKINGQTIDTGKPQTGKITIQRIASEYAVDIDVAVGGKELKAHYQ